MNEASEDDTEGGTGLDEYSQQDRFYAPRCEDCGILLARHGSDCGIETTDPRYEPEPAGWVGNGVFWPIDAPLPPTRARQEDKGDNAGEPQ